MTQVARSHPSSRLRVLAVNSRSTELPNIDIGDLEPTVLVLETNRAAGGQVRNARAADHFFAVEHDGDGIAADGEFHPVPLPERPVGAPARSEGPPGVAEAGLAQLPEFPAAHRIAK